MDQDAMEKIFQPQADSVPVPPAQLESDPTYMSELTPYSYGHLLVITGYKWDYTVYKWDYKYL